MYSANARSNMPPAGGCASRPLRSRLPDRCPGHARGVARQGAAAWAQAGLEAPARRPHARSSPRQRFEQRGPSRVRAQSPERPYDPCAWRDDEGEHYIAEWSTRSIGHGPDAAPTNPSGDPQLLRFSSNNPNLASKEALKYERNRFGSRDSEAVRACWTASRTAHVPDHSLVERTVLTAAPKRCFSETFTRVLEIVVSANVCNCLCLHFQ
jgi:hypothetical protein